MEWNCFSHLGSSGQPLECKFSMSNNFETQDSDHFQILSDRVVQSGKASEEERLTGRSTTFSPKQSESYLTFSRTS